LLGFKILHIRAGKNHDLKKEIGFFKFKSNFLNLNQIFLFKLNLLFELIYFSSKKIIKFYYKRIKMFFFTNLTKL